MQKYEIIPISQSILQIFITFPLIFPQTTRNQADSVRISLIYLGSKIPQAFRELPAALILRDTIAAQRPTTEHRKIVKIAGAVLLDGHCGSNHHPTGGTLHRDADGLIGRNARQSRHIQDIRLGVVLMRRRPFLDNHADGVEAVLMIVSTREQLT